MKIERTKQRIREWVDYYGENGTYISFSGGKDSTVLLDIVRSIYPNIEAVFINTGLEYPEIYKFVKTFKNVTILKPEMNFKQVINTYGYPVISKENSQYIYEIRHSTKKMRQRRLYGDSKGRFKLPNKYHYLIDAPFEISNKCCEVMKKRPVKKFEKETGKVPIIGTMAEESSLRQQSYLQHGCNAFESKRPVSTPLGFWKQQDVLEYIYKNDLKIASVYGEVIEDKNLLDECTYSTTGCERTGCIYCLYGIQCDTTPNRIQRLKKTHKKQYDYCINKLKLGEVLDYIGVKY
jgi:3'-phosphoadenosine 5'-phosphosulfate sulfotransferase (PAPS reductase)/FAD synthetase